MTYRPKRAHHWQFSWRHPVRLATSIKTALSETIAPVFTSRTSNLANRAAPKGKALSNAMRTGKRALAGVAAGALGLALVPMVGVSTASAATGTGGVTPVRVSYTSSVQDVTPYAVLYWSGISGQTADDSVIMTISTAPSGAAQVGVYSAAKSSSAATSYTGGAKLGTASTVNMSGGISSGDINGDGTDDSYIYVAADVAGSYAGYLTGDSGTKVNFSFATTGAPASLALTIDPAEIPKTVASADMFTLTTKDAAGSTTQPLYVDGIDMETTETGAYFDDTNITGSMLFAGTLSVGLDPVGSTAGVYTVTATPTGTPWASEQTGTYTVIDDVDATAFGAIDSSTQVDQATDTGSGGSGIAKPGTTTLSFGLLVDDADAGKPVVVTVGGDAFGGAANEPGLTVVPTDANGEGVLTVTVPAAGAYTSGAEVTIDTTGLGQYVSTYTTGTYYCTSDYTSRTPSAGVVAVPTGSAQEVSFSVDDSYGSPVAGLVVQATATGMTTQQSVTDSSGKASVTLPAPTASTTTSVAWSFTVGGKSGSTGACKGLTLQYSASAEVTITTTTINGTTTTNYTGTGSATSPAVIPFNGVIGGYTGATSTIGQELKLGATVGVAAVNVDFTAPDGVWFCAADDTYTLGTTGFAAGCAEGAFTYTASSTAISAYVTATKPGTYTVTGTTTSGNTATWSVTFANDSAAARNVAIAASPAKVSTGSASAVTVSVTDVFGNPVTLDTGTEKVTLVTDLGTLAGGTNIYTIEATDAAGKAVVSATSAVEGVATISATGSNGQFADLKDDPFTGAAASVYKASVPVEFTSGPSSQSIVIVGDREMISGKSYAVVDGNTTGFEEGDKVVPYTKFPGQSSYTAGTGIKAVDEDGEFYWKNKTAKKIYVKFKSEDGSVQSNRVIIQAK